MNIKVRPIKLTFTYEKIYTPTNEWASDYDIEPCQESFIDDCTSEFYTDIMKLEIDQKAHVELIGYPIDIEWADSDNEE
jgi:hypothetical protein